MLNLVLTDSSLYCAQWDYQERNPVLFSLVKVDYHSSISSIRSDPGEVKNTISTAISQVNDFNKIHGTTAQVIFDCSLTEKDSIIIGDLSENSDIEKFLLWTLKKRWGTQINKLSYSFIPGKFHYYYFAFPRILLAQLNNILNELGLMNISFQPIELIFRSAAGENGVLFNEGKSDSFFSFTENGITSCKILKRKDHFVFADIIGNEEDIKTNINDDNFNILSADKVKKENQVWKNRKIIQLTPLQNIITESIDFKMDISDRILNALDRSISQHSEGNDVNYFLNPFINIIDHEELGKRKQSRVSGNDFLFDKKNKSVNEDQKETGSKWIMFLLLITLSGLILLKNIDSEKWKDDLIRLFHPTNDTEQSTVQISGNSKAYQFEPYEEYNLSSAILYSALYTFESIEINNIIYLSSSDNNYTIVSSSDTLFPLLSSIGVIDNEIILKDNHFQTEFTLNTKKTNPNSFIQSVEEIISIFGKSSSLTSHRKLETKESEKFIYDPLILSFSQIESPLGVLNQMKDLGGNVLVRKIEYTPSDENRKKPGLTIYLSVIQMD